AFALHRLDGDGADGIVELVLEIFHVIERDKLNSRQHRLVGLAVLRLSRGGERSVGAAMEGIFHGEYPPLGLRSFRKGLLGIGASDFERAFPRFGTAVRQEYAIETGNTRQALGELHRELVVVKIRGVNQLRGLLCNRLQYRRVAIAQRIHSDSANEIEIPLALGVVEVYSLAALQKKR